MGVEDQHRFLVRAARQGNRLSVERDFHRTCVASPEYNLVAGVDRLHVRGPNDASDDELAVRLDGHPSAVVGSNRNLERLRAIFCRGV